jgi:hypothetical protein
VLLSPSPRALPALASSQVMFSRCKLSLADFPSLEAASPPCRLINSSSTRGLGRHPPHRVTTPIARGLGHCLPCQRAVLSARRLGLRPPRRPAASPARGLGHRLPRQPATSLAQRLGHRPHRRRAALLARGLGHCPPRRSTSSLARRLGHLMPRQRVASPVWGLGHRLPRQLAALSARGLGHRPPRRFAASSIPGGHATASPAQGCVTTHLDDHIISSGAAAHLTKTIRRSKFLDPRMEDTNRNFLKNTRKNLQKAEFRSLS